MSFVIYILTLFSMAIMHIAVDVLQLNYCYSTRRQRHHLSSTTIIRPSACLKNRNRWQSCITLSIGNDFIVWRSVYKVNCRFPDTRLFGMQLCPLSLLLIIIYGYIFPFYVLGVTFIIAFENGAANITRSFALVKRRNIECGTIVGT